MLATQISCVSESTPPPKFSLAVNTPIHNAADPDIDIEDYKPAKEDLKCTQDEDCIIIEKGCCYHEKPMAIRKDRAIDILTEPKKGIRAQCRKLNEDRLKKLREEKFKQKEFPLNICKGRESGANWTSGLAATCKKEGEKKFEEKAEGECTLGPPEAPAAAEGVEIWVKDPRAKISKRLKYKYGDTWGALRAEAAKLFGKEGILIYSPGKTFLDSHVVKEEEMKSKHFIMFLPN